MGSNNEHATIQTTGSNNMFKLSNNIRPTYNQSQVVRGITICIINHKLCLDEHNTLFLLKFILFNCIIG